MGLPGHETGGAEPEGAAGPDVHQGREGAVHRVQGPRQAADRAATQLAYGPTFARRACGVVR